MRESPSPRSAPTQAPAPGHSLPLWQLLIHTAEAVARPFEDADAHDLYGVPIAS